MSPLPIAVIGAGAIGRTHINLVSRHPGYRLSAIVDPDPAVAALAEKYDVPHLRQLDQSLLSSGARAAIVATPTSLHYEHALACIQLRLPMLLEKPVASSVTQASELDAAARRTGVPILVGHHRRHSPTIAAAREAIQQGLLGTVTAVSAHFLIGKPDSYFAPEWRRLAHSGGPILTNLIHDIDCLRFLLGEIEQVTALATSSRRGHAIEDTAGVLLQFASGAIGTMIGSDVAPGPFSWEFASGEDPHYDRQQSHAYVVAGTSGTLEIPTLKLWTQRPEVDWHKPLQMQQLQASSKNPLLVQLGHFLNVVENGAFPLVSVTDAARTLAVVAAVLNSAASGSFTPVERVQ